MDVLGYDLRAYRIGVASLRARPSSLLDGFLFRDITIYPFETPRTYELVLLTLSLCFQAVVCAGSIAPQMHTIQYTLTNNNSCRAVQRII